MYISTIAIKKFKRAQGFTLIELLVVTRILSFIILGFIQSLTLSSVLADISNISNCKIISVSEAKNKW